MRTVVSFFAIAFLVLTASQGGYHVSALDSTVAPYRWGLVEWETTHFLNKWRYRMRQILPWHRPPAKEEGLLESFFSLNRDIQKMEQQLTVVRNESSFTEEELGHSNKELKTFRQRQSQIRPQVEERLEGLISEVLAEQGFESRIGLIWPPVDVELISPPSVVVLSPRHMINRQRSINLRPNLRVEDMEAIEDKIFQEQNLSALVVSVGGVATYPSIVTPDSGLRHALVTGAHEWVHQFWFFRPVGWNYWRDADTTSLNETAADLAGREIGSQVYQRLGGKAIEADEGLVDGDFDFRKEMRTTRLAVEQLLDKGRVEEAEKYMEERRNLFVENGSFIRKLNQAYFSFFGAYGSNPASATSINDEVKRFRASVDTIGDFLRELSRFSSYKEFKEYLQELDADVDR